MEKQIKLISMSLLTLLVSWFSFSNEIKAQTAALYGNTIVSTESAPDWYFVCNSSTGEILQLSADKTQLEAATVPLSVNSDFQFWRFMADGENIMLINKGADDYEKQVTFTASGDYWLMDIDGQTLDIVDTTVSLGESAGSFMFVKAPVGGGKEWVQLRSYRTTGVTFLYENNGIVCHTTADNINAGSHNFRFVLNETEGCYYMTTKSQLGKYVYDSNKNSNGNMKFSDSEIPVKFVIHPLVNRKGYIHLTVKGVDISRIDYNGSGNPNAGLYTDNFTNAFGTRTNDGFRFTTVTYSEGFSDVLNLAINAAANLFTNTSTGNDPGEYSEADRIAFSSAIAAAQVVNNNEDPTELEINAATEALNAAVETYKTKVNGIKYSTENDKVWYYIVSASTSSYVNGKAIVSISTQDVDPLKFDTKRINTNMMWCFIKDDNDKVTIQNFATDRYIAKDLAGASAGTVADPQYNYTIALYEGDVFSGNAYTIQSDASSNPLHAQNNNSVIVTWKVEAANPSSLWYLREVSEEELNMDISISSSIVQQGRISSGIGNQDLPIIRATLMGEGVKGAATIKEIKGTLNGTTSLSDITKVKVYSASTDFELQPGKEMAKLLGEAIPKRDGSYSVAFNEPSSLKIGYNYLWVTLDISEQAQEGNQVDAQITSYVLGDDTEIIEANGDPKYSATIFLTESTLVRPGDDGSRYYRIPAIATAKNGWLVAVADKRWNSNGDLPNNIDVVAQVSKDNGKTWSDPQTIAGTAELGGDYGHGDPSIVVNRENGDIIVLVISKIGFFSGNGVDVPRMKTIISHDNGLTWDAPVDITDMIYGAGCSDPISSKWLSAFPTSGSFLQKRDGTLVVAMPVIRAGGAIDVFLALSKDGGITWQAAHGNGTTGADESKVVERNNGDLLLSVRSWGQNYKNISSDNGETWQLPAKTPFEGIKNANCNGDFKVYTSTLDGFEKNRMLHTNCFAGDRSNVSIVISYDEGDTWSQSKTICPRGSAYSALTILPDGSIGCYYEEDGLEGGYILRYVRFSLDWMTGGKDSFSSPVSISPVKKTVDEFTVTNENGIISVEGATNYTITSLFGINYPKDFKFARGIYIVSANGKSVKTIVK